MCTLLQIERLEQVDELTNLFVWPQLEFVCLVCECRLRDHVDFVKHPEEERQLSEALVDKLDWDIWSSVDDFEMRLHMDQSLPDGDVHPRKRDWEAIKYYLFPWGECLSETPNRSDLFVNLIGYPLDLELEVRRSVMFILTGAKAKTCELEFPDDSLELAEKNQC